MLNAIFSSLQLKPIYITKKCKNKILLTYADFIKILKHAKQKLIHMGK